MERQSRNRSVLFWIGLASAVYEAVVNSLVSAGVAMHPVVGAIKAAIDEAIQNGISGKWGGKRPPNLKLPLRDGDVDREEDEAYQDAYFVNATSLEKPGVVDRKRIPITDPLGVYSGCYVRASVNFYPFNVNGNKGVAAGLGNVQFWSDGEPLTSRVRAEDEFDALDVDDDEDFLN